MKRISRDDEVARALLEAGALGLSLETPVTFKSGLRSPVYVDNRRLPFHPGAWRTVLEALAGRLAGSAVPFDVLAGVEAAGIPHGAALAYSLGAPFVFVRKAAKGHGTRRLVEGGSVGGRRVLLVEDLVTTGASSLAAVAGLRAEGAAVEDCLAIVSYAFPEAQAAFAAAGVRLHALLTLEAVLAAALAAGRLEPAAVSEIEGWQRDPAGWAAKRGLGGEGS